MIWLKTAPSVARDQSGLLNWTEVVQLMAGKSARIGPVKVRDWPIADIDRASFGMIQPTVHQTYAPYAKTIMNRNYPPGIRELTCRNEPSTFGVGPKLIDGSLQNVVRFGQDGGRDQYDVVGAAR